MREEIIDVAIGEFTKSGWKFTMSDVAKTIGISKKTIYTVFDSKEEVCLAIADRYFADFLILERQVAADDNMEVLSKIKLVLCALPDKYHNLGLNNLYGIKAKYPIVYRRLMNHIYTGWQSVERYIKQGIEEGVIRPLSVPVVMAMIEGTVKQFMENDVLINNEITYYEAKRQMAEIITEGIKVR